LILNGFSFFNYLWTWVTLFCIINNLFNFFNAVFVFYLDS
jgi:hypothetical protein